MVGRRLVHAPPSLQRAQCNPTQRAARPASASLAAGGTARRRGGSAPCLTSKRTADTVGENWPGCASPAPMSARAPGASSPPARRAVPGCRWGPCPGCNRAQLGSTGAGARLHARPMARASPRTTQQPLFGADACPSLSCCLHATAGSKPGAWSAAAALPRASLPGQPLARLQLHRRQRRQRRRRGKRRSSRGSARPAAGRGRRH